MKERQSDSVLASPYTCKRVLSIVLLKIPVWEHQAVQMFLIFFRSVVQESWSCFCSVAEKFILLSSAAAASKPVLHGSLFGPAAAEGH